MVWIIWEFRNKVVFNGKDAHFSMALDAVRFRIAWWFKHFGNGLADDIAILLLDIKDKCIDRKTAKVIKQNLWSPPMGEDLLFNVDGSVRGSPG